MMQASPQAPVHVGDGCVVSWLRKLDQEETLLGVVDILSTPHHVYFVRVVDRDGVRQPLDDPHGRYDELGGDDAGGRLGITGMGTAVRVPGYPGEYVAIVHPFGS
jgi:hypothetical protein